MTEHTFLQQLFLLRQDIESTPMLDPFAAQQRDRWAARLGDLMNRRMADPDLQTTDTKVIACMGSVPECAANGCQFLKTMGYRDGEHPSREPVDMHKGDTAGEVLAFDKGWRAAFAQMTP
jgi:hypothetical protein